MVSLLQWRALEVPRFTPKRVPGLLGWWVADQIGLADAASVATWTDQSGNGNSFTQGTAGLKPLLKKAIINGHDVVRFDGVDDTMTAGNVISPTQITVVAVAKATDVTVTQTIIGKGLGGAYFSSYLLLILGSKIRFYKATNAIPNAEAFAESTFALTNNKPFIAVGQYNGATISCRVNGANIGTQADSTGIFYSTQPLRVGTLGNGTDLPYGGDEAEILIYNNILSNRNLYRVERYMSHKYGVALN